MEYDYVAKDNMYYPDLIKRKKERQVAKIRKCLKCGKPMESAWAGERLHRNCRESNMHVSDLEV